MNDFRKYESMRNAGATALTADLTARVDGLDAIKRTCMVRTVFGLTLPEAKAIHASIAATEIGQDVASGKKVYWETVEPDSAIHLWEANVDHVRDGVAQLSGHRRYWVTVDGLVETTLDKSAPLSAPLDMFKLSLSERLCQALPALDDIPQSSHEAV